MPRSYCDTSVPVYHLVSATAPECPPGAECRDLHGVQKNPERVKEFIVLYHTPAERIKAAFLITHAEAVISAMPF